VIKFVSDLRQVCGFLWFPPNNKADHHNITEILLKVALNSITIALKNLIIKIKNKKSRPTGTLFYIFILLEPQLLVLLSSPDPKQGSILSTKMVAWTTKFRVWRPKFKSGGQRN